MQGVDLRLQRKRRREALQIILVGIPSFRLQKELVGIFPGKGPEFVFNGRAIAGTDALDATREQRRAVEARPQNLVDAFVGMNQVATLLGSPLLDLRLHGKIREAGGILITRLHLQPRQIDRAHVDARRCPGLHPADGQSAFSQLGGETLRRQLPHPAPFGRLEADEHLPVEEGSGRQNHRFGAKFSAHPRADTRNMRFSEGYRDDRILPNV